MARDAMHPFGSLLRKLRREREITLQELAEKVRKTPAYLSQLETSKRHPPKEDLINLLAEGLGTSPDDLLRAAQLERAYVSLGLRNVNEKKTELALQLERKWGDLSDDALERIKKILNGS